MDKITQSSTKKKAKELIKSKEIRNRIKLSVAAYAYEKVNEPIMNDNEFDNLSKLINTKIRTGKRKLDKFFRDNFEPDSGIWINKHPELYKIEYIYKKYYRKDE